MKISIILPTYIERANITLLVSEILKIFHKKADPELEVIVVDDNSPDGTAEVCRRRFRKHKNISVYVRTGQPSLAASIAHGISHSTGEVIVVMDTDFNHDPHTIPLLIKHIRRYDLVVGSRFIKGGSMESHKRYILSRTYNRFLNRLFHFSLSDYLSGFYCIRKTHLDRINKNYVFRGYGEYFIRLLVFAIRNNLRIKEVPVYYKNRMYGFSKSKFFKMLIIYTHTALQEKATNFKTRLKEKSAQLPRK